MGSSSVVSYQGLSLRNEFFNVSGSRFLVEAGSGDDYVYSDFLSDILFGQGGRDLLRGLSGNDLIFGDFSADDSRNPLDGGADLVAAGSGDDTVYGATGNDYLNGEQGNDFLYGGVGNDLIAGGSGSDYIEGGAGKDVIYGASPEQTDLSFWAPINCDFDGTTDEALSGTVSAGAGGGYIEVAFGDTSPDTIFGGDGDDKVYGSLGSDSISGDAGNDSLYGNAGNDSMSGGTGNDYLSTSKGEDTLSGGDGLDTLIGSSGKDKLTGGAGADQFRFTSTPGSTNLDTVTDFKHGEDKIALDDAIFKALGSSVTSSEFGAKASGHVASDLQHIIYDKSNGTLWYDADDNGSGAAVQFATLSNKPQNLTYADFVIV